MGIETAFGNSFITTSISSLANWSRKNSLWPFPFATACCSIEFMSCLTSDFDIARFGAERPSFSPRQADVMFVLGTITYKMAPVMWKAYQTMAEPKWVICVGACASTGGMFDTYAVLQGIDRVIPVDMYVPGCPPRPEMILDALVKLQAKISKESVNDPKYKSRVEYFNNALNEGMEK